MLKITTPTAEFYYEVAERVRTTHDGLGLAVTYVRTTGGLYGNRFELHTEVFARPYRLDYLANAPLPGHIQARSLKCPTIN